MPRSSKVLASVSALAITFSVFVAPPAHATVTHALALSTRIDIGITQANHVRFDPSGRAWIWADGFGSEEVKVYVDELGTWSEAFAVNDSKLKIIDLDFATNGTMYSISSRNSKIGVTTFTNLGSIKTTKFFSVKNSRGARAVAVSPTNHLYVLSSTRIQEFRLPLKKRANKPIRTISDSLGWGTWPVMVADAADYVHIGNRASHNLIVGYSSDTSGTSDWSRQLGINTSWDAEQLTNGLATWSDGRLASLQGFGASGGVAVWANATNGNPVDPELWYSYNLPGVNALDFDISASGNIGILGWGGSLSFYTAPVCGLPRGPRC